MGLVRAFVSRLVAVFRKRRLNAELDDELLFHFEMEEQENRRRGLDPEEAGYAARRAFGGIEQAKEEWRRQSTFPWLGAIGQDLWHAGRGLRRSPGFSLVALSTLALTVGIALTVFAVVYDILFSPLPYSQVERLVLVTENWSRRNFNEKFSFAPGRYLDIRRYNRSFESVAAVRLYEQVSFRGAEEARRFGVSRVTANFFTVLGASPLLGRTFVEGEDRPGQPPVAVLSHGFWQRELGSDPAIVGKALRFDQTHYTVVGVMPAGFWYQRDDVELWVSDLYTYDPPTSRTFHRLSVLGRLKPGVSPSQAKADLDAIAPRLPEEFEGEREVRFNVVPFSEQLVEEVRPTMLLLALAGTAVLLVGCFNFAGLLLARNAERSRELVLRAALGAGRARLVRLLLAETLMITVAGCGFGVFLAHWGLNAVVASAPPNPYNNSFEGQRYLPEGPLQWGLAFAVVTGALLLFTAIGAGLGPALAGSRINLSKTLKSGGSGITANLERLRLRRVLLAAEVAFSVTLLTGAGLLIHSILRLQTIDPGFNTKDLLTAALPLPKWKYTTEAGFDATNARNLLVDERREQLQAAVLESVRAIAGVESAVLTRYLPAAQEIGGLKVSIPGPDAPDRSDIEVFHQMPWTGWSPVSDGYFRTLGIPIRAGRDFRDEESQSGPRVAIVNESFARSFFPDGRAVGRLIAINAEPEGLREIVGVAADIRNWSLEDDPKPFVYLHYRQLDREYNDGYVHIPLAFRLMVRSSLPAGSLASAVKETVHILDPDVPVTNILTMDDLLSRRGSRRRFLMGVLLVFALATVVTSLVGISGIVGFYVSRRTREIGIRVACGAGHWDILRLALAQAMTPLAVGTAAGLVGAYAVRSLLAAHLYQIEAADPATYVGAGIGFLIMGLTASLFPARRSCPNPATCGLEARIVAVCLARARLALKL